MPNKHTYVAIMAGGIGSRFWPVSRTALPKQFLDILGTGRTLIQQTFERFKSLVPVENIFVVTSDDYTALVAEQLSELHADNILSEPFRKNTAPCIAWISYKLHKRDPAARLIVAPADHLILEPGAFLDVCRRALSFAEHFQALLTIGITPTYPNTGYGYIQHDDTEAVKGVYKVKTFTEKPDLEIAKTFLASGDFLWNAGIFVWKTGAIIAGFARHLPELHEVFTAEFTDLDTADEREAIARIYPQCSSISIDFGVMEKADNVYVLPASFGWSDLGTWTSAWESMEKDYLKNAVNGDKVLVIDAHGCVVHTPAHKLVILQGLDDMVVVDTPDVLLICSKDKEQEIKAYVAEVKRNWGEEYL